MNREKTIEVPVNGNRLFNKHIAVVGATGSGKSCAIAKIIQTACSLKDSNFSGLNNTHVIIFDIHGEYLTAFPSANIITSSDLILPYWLMNDEEMDELFLEVGDRNNYNQASLLQSIITVNKKESNPTKRVFYDSPCYYDIKKVMQCFRNLQIETICAKDPTRVKIDGVDDRFLSDEEKYLKYSEKSYEFAPQKRDEFKKGSYSDGTIDKFVSRIQSKIANPRLDFIFGEKSRITCFEDVIRKLMGYDKLHLSNVTIFDLSGIPFEVLSITVSLITRLIFDYGYNYRKLNAELNNPFLLIYEEAHRYVPKSELVKYRASRLSIERIAKEGRKYGVTLLISSQRPSEISETIFSQCNNFIVMRISNPDDQNYVKNLLPENLGNIVSSLPSLECGEALLIGDSIIMPSYVYIPKPEPEPFSNDIPFYEKWKMPWAEIPFDKLMNKW
ncbi:ATP-binding protein [uncultured Methanospirillum sp.]|uniref:ATP-binding protein n=1 Tax=uncultured Methanospirillum sp. TaxID=262503 RepID=UPI0029C8DE1D|nr:ATP-binding protein [uncultured Methanospirillum sp.]